MLTAGDLAGRLGLPANDPKVQRAVDAALDWASGVYRLDDVEDLVVDDNQAQALAGYARDVLKLDKASFGYFAGNASEIPAAIGNIGRRWRPMLIGDRDLGIA